MNNEWLTRKEKRKTIDKATLDGIDQVVKNWQETGKGADKILVILHALADRVIDYLKPAGFKTQGLREEVAEEMINGCIVRMRRVNTEKGRAFNFFTTIMLAILRQMTATRKDYKEMKEQYREYIASRNSRDRGRRQA